MKIPVESFFVSESKKTASDFTGLDCKTGEFQLVIPEVTLYNNGI